jgi:transposase InsO family protein
MGIGVFPGRPDCRSVCAFFGRSIRRVGTAPKYVVCDRDSIFDCEAFRRWIKRKGIKPPRYGAVGKHGSVAVVERFILSMKTELTHRIAIPMGREAFLRELRCYRDWFNEHRPHTTLGGRTPNEVYFKRRPANRRLRVEPRPRWPRGSPCSKPWALVAGKPGAEFAIRVDLQNGRRHLPVITLKRAA